MYDATLKKGIRTSLAATALLGTLSYVFTGQWVLRLAINAEFVILGLAVLSLAGEAYFGLRFLTYTFRLCKSIRYKEER